ncbi:MAG: hypothetical protein AB7G06_08860 [Bdellovibrionales bacterium]
MIKRSLLLGCLLVSACATDTTMSSAIQPDVPATVDKVTVPNNVLMPRGIYIGEAYECNKKNVNIIRYRADKTLDMCTPTGWAPIVIEGDSRNQTKAGR